MRLFIGSEFFSPASCFAIVTVARAQTCKLVVALTRLFITLGTLVFLASEIAGTAAAQARLISIDTPITARQMELFRKYLDDIDVSKARVYAAEFEGLIIARFESDASCLADKCLTVVARQCAKETCPHVKLLAASSVFSNPLYVEVFGGLRSVAFGRPGNPSTAVIFGDSLMLVATAP
jgi:hypothetical protein